MARNEVLIFYYMDDSVGCQSSKKSSKGNRELHNLEWEMKDGIDLKGLTRANRARRGKSMGWKQSLFLITLEG